LHTLSYKGLFKGFSNPMISFRVHPFGRSFLKAFTSHKTFFQKNIILKRRLGKACSENRFLQRQFPLKTIGFTKSFFQSSFRQKAFLEQKSFPKTS